MTKRNERHTRRLLTLAAGLVAITALQAFAGAEARGCFQRFGGATEVAPCYEAGGAGDFPQLVQAAAQSGVSTAAPSSSETAYVPTLTFDVASVRQSADQNSYMLTADFHEGTFRAVNFSIQNLLMMAYGLGGYHEVAGIPESFRWVKFNVQAKADDSAEKLAKLNQAQVRMEQQHMLQVLLAKRFQLKAHWETKQGEIYKLVVGNRGKLRETKVDPTGANAANAPDEHPPLYQRGDSRSGFEFVGHGCSMEMLVDMLARFFGRPVTDKTGLSGRYDFVLPYNRIRATDENNKDSDATPSLETAIQDQLGLKLEPAKGPVRSLVVDHVERPSEN